MVVEKASGRGSDESFGNCTKNGERWPQESRPDSAECNDSAQIGHEHQITEYIDSESISSTK